MYSSNILPNLLNYKALRQNMTSSRAASFFQCQEFSRGRHGVIWSDAASLLSGSGPSRGINSYNSQQLTVLGLNHLSSAEAPPPLTTFYQLSTIQKMRQGLFLGRSWIVQRNCSRTRKGNFSSQGFELLPQEDLQRTLRNPQN